MPSLHFIYLAKLYLKNLLALLFGLSLAFSLIDYFQYMQKLPDSSNYQILYIYYMFQEALGLLYPLAIVFAVIMTKLSMIKNNTMAALHAFGYSKKELFKPFFAISLFIYLIFMFLHMTSFSYAKDKANLLLKQQIGVYDVNDIFFKYNDTFVYVKKLDPVHKKLFDLTLFKVKNDEVLYTVHAVAAKFEKNVWIAENAIIKTHIYDTHGELQRYITEKKSKMLTLKGYKPQIIESFYDGKALNMIDAYRTWRLMHSQSLNSDKIRAVFYDKIIVPLFALALALILFFKLPFYSRMMNLSYVIASSLGVTFVVWGILFGLGQMGRSGAVIPEVTAVVPVLFLWSYAIYIYFTDEKSID